MVTSSFCTRALPYLGWIVFIYLIKVFKDYSIISPRNADITRAEGLEFAHLDGSIKVHILHAMKLETLAVRIAIKRGYR